MKNSATAKTQSLHLTFYGGAGTVTGANFLLADDKTRLLIDCGLFQGQQVVDDLNRKPFSYRPSQIDALFITHAHLDHIGRIPLLVRNGFNGTIYSTPETKKLSEVILEDALRVMTFGDKKNKKETLYSKTDMKQAFSLWKTLPYHEEKRVGTFTVFFKDAGHILGSTIVELVHEGGVKVAFTGDLGNSPAPILRDTEALTDVNYLVMESVYGDRQHESVEERAEYLEDIIENTVQRNGVLMIPAFSLERTQTLLYEINNLVERGKIPKIPVFLDSPLAIRITEIYKNSDLHFNKETRNIIASGDDIFHFPGLILTSRVEESKNILKAPNPKIIIAGSGMSHGGRILHHEKRYLSDPNNTLLIVGYQSAGSIGRQLQDGAKSINIFDEEIPVHAKIRTIRGYSAHKDSDGLVDFVHETADTLKKVFVTMGEPRSSLFLVQRLRDYLGVNAVVPKYGERFTLD